MKTVIWNKLIPIQPRPPNISSSSRSISKDEYRRMLQSYFPSLPELAYDGKARFAVSLKFCLNGNTVTSHREIDLDNLIKSTLDACTGFFWKDDSQVNEINAKIKRQAEKSSIKIKVWQLPIAGQAYLSIDEVKTLKKHAQNKLASVDNHTG